MSKYQPLSDRLRGHAGPEWQASFAEIEEVLGFPLPKGARSGRAWWANDADKSHVKAWTEPGWQAHVDPEAGAVTFRRGDISALVVEAVAGLDPVGEIASEDLDVPPPPAGRFGAETLPQPAASSQPAELREAADHASRRWRQQRTARAAGLIAGSVALVAGLTALVLRRVRGSSAKS